MNMRQADQDYYQEGDSALKEHDGEVGPVSVY
jgi:hypothetical protein